MRIKRLDITGFKSFMSKTVFVFGDGVTGIVGPNGCGKSNVVDAIRWVMGEQSARHLRGRSMEDVIFNGSDKHLPLGMAEVSITFLNDRGDVPQQYAELPEITVTRRLFRNGESEYLINRSPCRLLDIIELFLGTGVGTRAYSIIEQGRIGLIVSAKPEDRRSLIEEAAGVTKYKARRRSAERKMEYTEQNLVRLSDILGEQKKRLDALQRQVQKAEKYKAIKAEIRGAELHLASLRWLELQAMRKLSASSLATAGAEQEALGQEVEALELSIASARARLDEESRELEQKSERVAALSQGAALNQTNLDFYARERQQLDGRLEELAQEIRGLEERLVALDAEVVETQAQQAQLTGQDGDDHQRVEALEREAAELQAAEREASARLEVERAAAMEVLSRAAATKGELLTIDRRRSDIVDRIAKLRGEGEGIEAEIERLERQRKELSGRKAQAAQLKLELETRRGEEGALLEKLRLELVEAEEELLGLREELADKRSRLQSLEELQRSYDAYGSGVRAVMTGGDDGESPAEGVVGLVSALLQVPERFERAIEAVLGERLQAVVVGSEEVALEQVHRLLDLREGRATFFADGMRGRRAAAAPEHPAILARAADEVRMEGREALVEALLADVYLVGSLDEALELGRAHPGLTWVSLQGEVVGPWGAITGGVDEGPGAGLLQKKREVEELREVVAALEGRVATEAERHRRLAQQCEQLDESVRSLARTGHEEDLNLLHAEKDLGRTTEELSRLRTELEEIGLELEGLENQLGLLDMEAERTRGAAAQAEADRGAREQRAAELSADLNSLRESLGRVQGELTRLRIEAAANEQRREGVARTLERLARERVQVEERKEKALAAVAQTEARVEELSQQVEEASGSISSLEDELNEANAALAEARARHAELQAEVGAQEQALRDKRRKLEELAGQASARAIRDRELELEIVHLQEGIQERYQLSLEEEVHAFHLLPMPEEGLSKRLAALRTQVERMGEVNLTALEEHEELSERYGFLEQQRLDLEKSLAKLRQAIAKIDATCKERFDETFQVVNENFMQVFPRLFGGGKAKLMLVRDENKPGAEPGVEIVAQPPGKKMQNVNLMSGGEKALTAVSLIFAIFLVKPTPFCLLDEVDAPLDEANVGRYNEMVKEMSKGSQFILITHNKRTMEIADTLYGVTMEEPGISKTVSVKLTREEEGPSAEVA